MSEPTKVTVYVAPEGTWLEIVGEDDALDLTRPVRVVFERDYAKLAQALTLATQRAEAAGAERDRLQPWYDGYMKVADAICAGSTGPDDLAQQARALRAERDAWVNKFEDLSSMTGAERRLDRDRMYKLEAERDALRKDAARLVVDDAMVDRALNAFYYRAPGMVSDGLARQQMRAALDAALVVQP